MNRSLEQWRQDCLASQQRADCQRLRVDPAAHDHRIGLTVAGGLITLVGAWWTVTLL